eukprot:CAMPEP_0197503970 /NCGR_PEP_ID=MMETSP1312-20131121/3121_1 /TAXON_ID=464262 /ORGANISM="Genus nov. species nov., Strain RCC2335" /LENGTH=357 /DNA_ID=CAMNT_0043050749 /DNA_START=87 /DNA_END=1160 /DNA_ORIENTATION=+
MSGRLGFTLDSTNRSSVSRASMSTARGTGSLKKRTAKSLDYELDKARKDNQLLREALQAKEAKIQELRSALDEIKRLSTSELGEATRALAKREREKVQLKRQLASSVSERDRGKEQAQAKLDVLKRERRECVRALHSVASHCVRARNQAEPVYGREEVFPKKVEPWLQMTYDAEFTGGSPRKSRGGRSTLRGQSHHTHKTLPFRGAGKPLVEELVALCGRVCEGYAREAEEARRLRSECKALRRDLEESREDRGGLAEAVDGCLARVADGRESRGMDPLPKEAESCSDGTKLRMVSDAVLEFTERDREVRRRCDASEAQALELEFYAKLHGKLVKQAIVENLSPTKEAAERARPQQD